jgi:colanic acid biosynthesis glycosyl transferase WcaI
MRVLILSIYHDPEPIPKTGELARELKRRGHDVEVVTAFPHYPSGDLYPGYRLALWTRETIQGVPVLRTFIYPYHGTKPILRILNYVSWMFSAMLAAVLTRRVDVMYVWHPPLTVGVTAWVIARLKRVPFLYDVQDLWPEGAVDAGLLRPGRVVDLLSGLADWVYARATRIFVVSDEAAALLVQRGVPRAKIHVAKHWADDQILLAVPRLTTLRSELGLDEAFVVMFAGNIGRVQGLDTVIEAARQLRAAARIVFLFVGDGLDRERLERLASDEGLSSVRFAGAHPAADMPDWYAAADVLLVHVRPGGVASHAVPTKILSYLASGKPILCAMGGAAARLVEQADAGVTVAAGDAAALAAAVRSLSEQSRTTLAERGRRGREFFTRTFTHDVVIGEYERALEDLAGRHRRSQPHDSAAENTE